MIKLREFLEPCRFNIDDQLLRALRFAHGLGVLHYYGSPGDGVLGDFVFLRPQWLVDVMRRLVTSEVNKGAKLVSSILRGASMLRVRVCQTRSCNCLRACYRACIF